MESEINPAEVQLERVTESTRQTLWNLLQYMLFETSPSGNNVANEDGSFDYKYFDNYFTDSDRDAYLIISRLRKLCSTMAHTSLKGMIIWYICALNWIKTIL